MKKIARINVDDCETEEVVNIYALLNNGKYSVVLSNGNDAGLSEYNKLEELERSVEAAWGNWYTFHWSLE